MPSAKKPKRENQIIEADGVPRVAKQVDRAAAMEIAEMYVVKNLPKYLKRLHALAMGITVVRDTKGGPQIYSVPPDRAALESLVDRGLGKTPQRHEITGEGGGPMEILPWRPREMLTEGDIIDAEVVQNISQPQTDDIVGEQEG